jgi:hypothetical protein
MGTLFQVGGKNARKRDSALMQATTLRNDDKTSRDCKSRIHFFWQSYLSQAKGKAVQLARPIGSIYYGDVVHISLGKTNAKSSVMWAI